jgi:energy-coupling factor transporter ATP-binding protein EcfA2
MTGGYGTGANILHGCTVAVDKGQIAVIVGPNGAGKSTAMKAIFGMLNLREGLGPDRRRGHHRPQPAGARRQGHGLRAADLEHLHLDDGRGEPRDGRLPAPRRHPGTMEQVYTSSRS